MCRGSLITHCAGMGAQVLASGEHSTAGLLLLRSDFDLYQSSLEPSKVRIARPVASEYPWLEILFLRMPLSSLNKLLGLGRRIKEGAHQVCTWEHSNIQFYIPCHPAACQNGDARDSSAVQEEM